MCTPESRGGTTSRGSPDLMEEVCPKGEPEDKEEERDE
jgi:hypothetical protein